MRALAKLTLAVALLGAGMTAAEAVESDSSPLAPVSGVELGARLTSQAAPSLQQTSESPESESIIAEAPPPRPERKVRVVYPLPR